MGLIPTIYCTPVHHKHFMGLIPTIYCTPVHPKHFLWPTIYCTPVHHKHFMCLIPAIYCTPVHPKHFLWLIPTIYCTPVHDKHFMGLIPTIYCTPAHHKHFMGLTVRFRLGTKPTIHRLLEWGNTRRACMGRHHRHPGRGTTYHAESALDAWIFRSCASGVMTISNENSLQLSHGNEVHNLGNIKEKGCF